MQITGGKHTGRIARLRQFANDWMMVDIEGVGQGLIVKPTMVRLDDDEYWRMRESYVDFWQKGDRSCGQFWALWELRTDCTMSRRPRQRATG